MRRQSYLPSVGSLDFIIHPYHQQRALVKNLEKAGISEDELASLHTKFRSYFPQLSKILEAGRGTVTGEAKQGSKRFISGSANVVIQGNSVPQ